MFWLLWGLSFPYQALGFNKLEKGVHYVPGEVLVRFKTSALEQDKAKVLSKVRQVHPLSVPNVSRLELPIGLSVEDAIRQFQQDPSVDVVQPNYIIQALANSVTLNDFSVYSSNPTLNNYDWPFEQVDYPSVPGYPASLVSPASDVPVTIAVLDSGLDINNPDLPPSQFIAGENFYDSSDPTTDTTDHYGHGTFVSGIIAGLWNNTSVVESGGCTDSYGGSVAGVIGAPGLAVILPVQILDVGGDLCSGACGSTESEIEGLQYAVSMGAKVINMSFGGGTPNQMEQDAINAALASGCVVVAAAGNESDLYGTFTGRPVTSLLDYPAGYPGVIAVGATDPTTQISGYSNTGTGQSGQVLSLVAPGGSGKFNYDPINDFFGAIFCGASSDFNVPSPPSHAHYATAAGSSFSTPLVSGAAALLWALNPLLTATDIKDRLLNSARPIDGQQGWNALSGYGLLDIGAAISMTQDFPTTQEVADFLTTFNSPNPFYPDIQSFTNITLAIDQPEDVELNIYDESGERVFHKSYTSGELNNNPVNPQFKSFYVPWNGRNGSGQEVQTGVYFYTVKINGQVGHNKIAVIRGSK